MNRRTLYAIILCSLLLLYVPPSVAQSTTTPTTSEAVIDQIKKSVVFLEGDFVTQQMTSVNGTAQPMMIPGSVQGTGFLIFTAEPRLGPDRGFLFLVTNKHLIREPSAQGVLGEGPYLKELIGRINLKNANAAGNQLGLFRMTVVNSSGSLEWYIDPEDDSVDLAVIALSVDQSSIDYKAIPDTLFATKDVLTKEHITENDEILFAGLFARNPGARKNYPIVRHGKLARLAAEPIPIDIQHPQKTVEVHLADVMSFGGNSGSPVFLRVGGIREEGLAIAGYSYYLLGIMKGYFPEGMGVAVNLAVAHGVAAENSGIAAVIPADKLVNILNSPRVRAFRDSQVAIQLLADGKLDAAAQSFRETIEILEKSSPQHTDLATALETYGQCLRKMHSEKEAIKAESRAASIRTNIQTDRLNPRF